MTRYEFAGDIPSFVIDPDETNAVKVVPGSVVTFWTGQTDGTQYLDLLDMSNQPITSMTAGADGGIPRLQGPDDITVMWAQADDGTASRRKMLADVGPTARQAAADSAAANTGLQTAPWLVYQAADGSWPAERPSTTRPVVAVGTTVPAWLLPLDMFLQTSGLLA